MNSIYRKFRIKKIVLVAVIVYLFSVNICNSVSIVYNLRIAEITKRQITEALFNKPFIAAITIFDQTRKTHEDIFNHYNGGLASFIYIKKNFYCRLDGAAGKAFSKKNDIHLSRTQSDDILFTSGYGFSINKQVKTTISGLFGIPTHKDFGLEGVQFGTGHYALGLQWDGGIYNSSTSHPFHKISSSYCSFFSSNG